MDIDNHIEAISREGQRLAMAALILLALVAASCTPSTGENPVATTRAEATASTVIEATFDGDGCSLVDTTEVAAGDYAFIMTSSVSKPADVAVQPVPHEMTWDAYASSTPIDRGQFGEAPVSFSQLPDDLREDQRARRYIVDEGDYGIWALRLTPPTGVFLCGRLAVSE